MTRVQCTPLIGLPQFDGWSQVVQTSSHQLLVAFAVAGANAGNVGRDVLDFVSTSQPQSAADVHTLVTKTLQIARDKGTNVQLAVALVLPKQTVLAVINGAILLKREQRVGVVLRSSGEVQLVAGKTHPEDIMVLATEQASEFLGEIQQRLERGYELDTIITSLVPTIHGAPQSALSALAFVSHGPTAEVAPGGDPATSEVPTETVSPAADLFIHQTASPRPMVPEFDPPAPINRVVLPADALSAEPQTAVAGASAQYQRLVPRLALKQRLSGGGRKIAALGGFLRRRFDRRPGEIYVGGSPRIARKWWRWLVVLLVLLLVAAVAGGWWRWQVGQQVQAATGQVAPLQAELVAAQSQLSADPVAARERVAVVVSQLEQLEQQFQTKRQRAARQVVVSELAAARQIYQDISGRQELQELPTFFDLSLVQADFVSQAAVIVDGQVILVDKGSRQAVVLDPAKKSTQVLSLGVAAITDVASNGEQLFSLGQGLWQLPVAGTGSATLLREEGDSNRGGTFLGAFGPYIYTLNPEKRALYRYLADKDGKLSEPIGWLRATQNLEFSEVTGLTIDGEVWLGTRAGQIKRFASGQQVEFAPRGLTEPLSTPVVVQTVADAQELYVLEPARRRLLVLSKADGTLLREVTSPSLAAVTQLVIVPEQQLLLALSGSMVFEVKLTP